MKRLNRLALAFIFALTGCGSSTVSYSPPQQPNAATAGRRAAPAIEHVIVMVQENRSFENLFAGYPGANAPLEGACKPNRALKLCLNGAPVKLQPITLETTDHFEARTDIAHGHQTFDTEYDG